MACSMQGVIDPETTRPITYESSIKSGTHGEVYQKQLAQVLLLRLTRQRKDFQLAYEMTAAEKFDDVVLYDAAAKQWIFLQSKHADGKDSKIDLNGLLPKTNREKADFSLYKYFYSYMIVQHRFKGKVKFLLFTNKKLDEKLKTAGDYMSFEDRDVDEYLRFNSEGATHKLLTPTEPTIQSIMEYVNKDLYFLKDAIKDLFTEGIITNELSKYKTYLNDILTESGNQIRFKDTFNDSLIFIAKLYKVLKPDLLDLKPIDKPLGYADGEVEYDSLSYPSVEGQDFEHLIDAIRNLFRTGILSDFLKTHENLLALILTTTANGQLAFKDSFSSDIIWKAELYRTLKAELGDLNKKVTTKQKLFDGKASRNKHHSVLLYAEEPDVRQFFTLLTLSVHQPDELEPFIVKELHLGMRMWLRPDVLGKLAEDDDKNAVKDLDDYFESTLKCGQGNSKPFLDQHFVTRYSNKLRSKIFKLFPELNDTNQLYINREIIFDQENIDTQENLQGFQFDGIVKSKPDCSLGKTITFSDNSAKNRHGVDDRMALLDRTSKEMTDRQFSENLKMRFAHYQCLVLTADPGIGKTELFQYVALEHQKLTSGAVFLFRLNRIQDSKDVLGNETSLEILKPALSQKNLELIQNHLRNKSNDLITMLFDGYDEIHERNKTRINKLFELLLKSKQIQLVISARNHEKNSLQRFFQNHNFNVGYFTLEPFNSENVIEYLAQFWNEKCDFNSKFDSYSKFLIEKFYSLCRVPLMVKMMAKIYKQRFKEFKETMIDKEGEISLLEREFSQIEQIYGIFIENCLLVKIEDACHGIGKVDPNKQIFDGFYLDHQLLAIKFLDVGDLKHIFKNPKYMKKWDCIQKSHQNQLEKSILLNFVDGKVSFTHHSYAEYFVAKFLWDDFINLKNIINKVLSRFTGIREFFIKKIEENIDLFVSKFAQQTSFVSKEVAFWACESNAVELLKYVLSKKFLSMPNKVKMLQIAIKNGSDKICSYLIDDYKVHPNVKYDGGLAALHWAVIYGHRNLVHLLLERGADINIRNTGGWSALHYAVHHKRILIAQFLLDKGMDVNCSNNDKWNPLHIACNNGDANVVKILIQKNADLDIQTIEGKTPLYLATAGGHAEIVIVLIENMMKKFPFRSMFCVDYAFQIAVRYGHSSVQEMLKRKYPNDACAKDIDDPLIHFATWQGIIRYVEKLIDEGTNVNAQSTALHLSASASDHRLVVELPLGKGANVNAVETNKSTPLHLACQNGHTKVAEKLMTQKSLVNAMGHNYQTLLNFACENGHKDVVDALIREGANIEALTLNKCTALHISAFNGHCDIVDLLLDKGANVNAVKTNNWTPLHFACQNGHKMVVEVLLKQKANIDALTHDSSTPLHLACLNGHKEVAEILLRQKANIDALDHRNRTPLHFACQNKHKDVVETLIERGAKIDALTQNKCTALHLSAFNDHMIIVDLLLSKGANVNAIEVKKWTPLHFACQDGRKEVVEILLKQKAKIDALDYQNRTPLHLACENGHKEVVKILIREKANIDAMNHENCTPLHLACWNGHAEVVEILLREKVNINALTRKKYTPLDVAFQNGHCDVVKILLRRIGLQNLVTYPSNHKHYIITLIQMYFSIANAR
ncbi:uncharacterized protein LOC115268503 [Aedes albopictus]|uniref:NACHT domain-containing protein n=1 Tax=Aedes albopictus TaxID=7160 RepID=A0ABM1ZFQ4_AEDAL|nr:uncharacterized protein LOC115268503 [Aedes albopictus]